MVGGDTKEEDMGTETEVAYSRN
jgi:hypothetical protein